MTAVRDKGGRIILHIGLPKTATTAIQKHLFQLWDEKEIKYIGVRQPRSAAQREAYIDIMEAVGGGRAGRKYDRNICRAKEALMMIMQENETVVFSDEMVLVDDHGIRWQEKIRNLGAIVEDWETQVLLTVRNPVEGVYSYYRERLGELGGKEREFWRFIKGNAARIYKYKDLCDVVFEVFDKESVIFVPFEWLAEGDKYVSAISALVRGCGGEGIKMGRENESARGENGYITKERRLGEIMRRYRNTLAGDIVMRIPGLSKVCTYVYRWARDVRVGDGLGVVALTEREKVILRERYKEDVDYLFELTGIDYR